MAGPLAELLGQDAQVRGAWVFGAVYAMAEARELFLAIESILNALGGGVFIGELQEDLDHVLVGAAVQRSFQSADGAGDARVDVGERGGGDARGESGGVQ